MKTYVVESYHNKNMFKYTEERITRRNSEIQKVTLPSKLVTRQDYFWSPHNCGAQVLGPTGPCVNQAPLLLMLARILLNFKILIRKLRKHSKLNIPLTYQQRLKFLINVFLWGLFHRNKICPVLKQYLTYYLSRKFHNYFSLKFLKLYS